MVYNLYVIKQSRPSAVYPTERGVRMKERLIPGLVLICLLLIALVVLMTLIPMKSIVDETKRRKVSKKNAGGAETKRDELLKEYEK